MLNSLESKTVVPFLVISSIEIKKMLKAFEGMNSLKMLITERIFFWKSSSKVVVKIGE